MISVAMATYNGEKYIKKQIESILANISEEDEIIVSDDGSKDRTIDIIESFDDKRIKVFMGPQKGINANFENAFKHCKGEYIFISDQDDWWYAGKVKYVLRYLRKNDILLVQHNADIGYSDGTKRNESFFEIRKVGHGIIRNIIKCSYHGSCIAFKRELLEYVIPIPCMYFLYDQWIGIMAEKYGKTLFLKKKLMCYFRHGDNVSTFEKKMPFYLQIRNRLCLILCIVHKLL